MLPVVLKPQLLSIKNRWLQRSSISRELILILLSILLIRIINKSAVTFLNQCKTFGFSSFELLDILIAPVLCIMFFVLFFSSLVHSFTAFFLAKDLDIILSSPASSIRIFMGKYLEVTFGTLWMILVFGIPFLCALIPSETNTILFILILLFTSLLILFLSSASSLAIILLATNLFKFGKPRQGLAAFLLIGAVLLFSILSKTISAPEQLSMFTSLNYIKRLSSISENFFPITLIADIILESVSGSFLSAFLALLSSLFILLSLLIVIYLIFKASYFESYSQIHSSENQNYSRSSEIKFLNIELRGSPLSGIARKEFKCFSRDIVHTFQLTLLTAICFIYLYNFQHMQSFAIKHDSQNNILQHLLFLSNLAMGAFVITALSTRFVFPSISLEGRSMWIIRTSPLSLKNFVNSKFWTWYTPVSLIACTILIAGTLALDCSPDVILLTAIGSFILTYGIIGLAVGFGARFANFEWEHSSQICSSFGSLFYMLTSTLFILLNIAILCFIIWIRITSSNNFFSPLRVITITSISTIIFCVLNYGTTKFALKYGARALEIYE